MISGIEKRLAADGLSLQAIESDPSIFYLLQADLRIVYCNESWNRFAGENGGDRLTRSDVIGASPLDAMAEPLRPFYEAAFLHVQHNKKPWEHDYECSTPELFRLYRMRALPLADSYVLVENSLRVEHPFGADRPAMPAADSLYLDESGILTMCCHCRRSRRVSPNSGQAWDWVPSYLKNPPGAISHGLCPTCRAYFYS